MVRSSSLDRKHGCAHGANTLPHALPHALPRITPPQHPLSPRMSTLQLEKSDAIMQQLPSR